MEWVTINKCAELTGYSAKAIQIKKERGIWKEGIHWTKAPDGRIFINIHSIQNWVAGAA
ncbi:MAG: excisionase [Pseudomonadota bacterium]